jgi:hypothetical protein
MEPITIISIAALSFLAMSVISAISSLDRKERIDELTKAIDELRSDRSGTCREVRKLKSEIRSGKGIKKYQANNFYGDADKVVERRGYNTKFYLDGEIVASVEEGSPWSVETE